VEQIDHKWDYSLDLLTTNLQIAVFAHQLLILYKVLTKIRFLFSTARFSKMVQTGVKENACHNKGGKVTTNYVHFKEW